MLRTGPYNKDAVDTLAFLRKVLPSSGLYVIARLTDKGFRHTVCATLEEAAAYALNFDAQGVPTYHACAAFREESVDSKPDKDGNTHKQVRTHSNVRALKSFFMDLDVKPGVAGAFESQEAALDGLIAFVQETKLPMPMVINSGNGIHIYWTLTHEVNQDQWKQTAAGLKALAGHHKFAADPAVTSDPARVLRPVGTYNRKQPTDPRAVGLLATADDVAYNDFANATLQALRRAGVKPPETVKARETEIERLNESAAIHRDFPPCSAEKVASRCAQLAKMRDTRGNIPEPLWYAGIQLMCHSVEGDELIHKWSNGYAGYTSDETDKKIAQIRAANMGPTLCSTFESRNPGGCQGCPFNQKISSPAQLGAEIKAAEAPVVTQLPTPQTPGTLAAPVELKLPNAPAPFTRKANQQGIYMEEEGILHKLYDYDCFPIDLLYDEAVGYEVVRIRHWLPMEGWEDIDIPSALIAKPTDFEVELRKQGVCPLIKTRFILYMDSYMRELRKQIKVRRLFRTMGWKEEGDFVLGDRLYQKDGSVITSGASHSVSKFLSGFHAKGDLERWVSLTEAVNHKDRAAHAFVLLLGFAAPLLELGGLEGFTVGMVSDTGAGKSTMGRWLSSIYGKPKLTWLDGEATRNARIEALGAFNSVPVYIDEITPIKPDDLREMIYMIPTGKGKSALTRTREIKQGTKWQTILVASSNDSLVAKLQMEKANPEAESMRLFEFEFPKDEQFIQFAKQVLYSEMEEHYGTAGGEFIRRLVMEQDRIRPELGPAVAQIEREFGMQAHERFWARAAALTLYAGKLAKQWGLIEFDPEIIRPWLLTEINRMRGQVVETKVTPMELLAQFLDAHIGERLVVTKVNLGIAENSKLYRGKISQRFEKDSGILYISRNDLKTWVERQKWNWESFRKGALASGALENDNDRKTLGAGTDIKSRQIPCWRLDANHPAMDGKLEVYPDAKP